MEGNFWDIETFELKSILYIIFAFPLFYIYAAHNEHENSDLLLVCTMQLFYPKSPPQEPLLQTYVWNTTFGFIPCLLSFNICNYEYLSKTENIFCTFQ